MSCQRVVGPHSAAMAIPTPLDSLALMRGVGAASATAWTRCSGAEAPADWADVGADTSDLFEAYGQALEAELGISLDPGVINAVHAQFP